MSIIFSLFVFLSCLCMQACNARRFGVVDKGSSRQLLFSGEVAEKVKLNMDSIQRGAANGDSNTQKSQGGAVTQKPNESKALLKEMKYTKGAISGVVRIKSLVSVSWHVPRKNNDEHPGFYSDYSRPRTRPPSHN